MRNRLLTLLNDANALTSPVERRMAYVALIRIMLQHSCILLAERIVARRRLATSKIEWHNLPIPSLRVPADGTLLAALCEMLVIAENEGAAGVSTPVLRPTVTDRSCWRLLDENESRTGDRLLNSFIDSRNDGVEGHGLMGAHDLEAEGDAVAFLIDSLDGILPRISESRSEMIMCLGDGRTEVLTTCLLYTSRCV